MEFFSRHYGAWTHQAGIHAAHGGAHDLAHVTDPSEREKRDTEFDQRMVELTLSKSANNGPSSEAYGPLSSQFVWQLFRAIDWTHMHHEQTYDILSDADIPMADKAKWTNRSVKYYLENFEIPRSVAPLDVTMRRADVMMKPYFSYFRTHFPKTNGFFWVAHWWHPAIYEAQILGGNGPKQDEMVKKADSLIETFLKDRPKRMLLSREMMPTYSKLSPESANIFDNLHMLHGIAYDIMTYPKWSPKEKQKELERVINAMKNQPGDENLARKFSLPREKIDPTQEENWMVTVEGSMSSIMKEMMEEMLPHMAPNITADQKEKVSSVMKQKMAPGLEKGENPGSLHDALMEIIPDMKMNKEAMKAGNTPQKMIDAMLKEWKTKYGSKADVEPYSGEKI